MLSVEMSEVSSVPGREVRKSCCGKLVSSDCQSRMRSTQKYWVPTTELRFSHCGFSGSAGGRVGLGPTWQNAQLMPTR
jgi:hypothetical protein